MMDNKISKYFTYAEVTIADQNILKRLGIDNNPSAKQLENIKTLCIEVLDKVREGLDVPIGLTSCYRSPKYNDQTPGASPSSQHTANKGAAADIDCALCGGTTNAKIFNFIKDNLDFDQLIWEHGNTEEPDWVHVSYNKGNNRKQILKAVRIQKVTMYLSYGDKPRNQATKL